MSCGARFARPTRVECRSGWPHTTSCKRRDLDDNKYVTLVSHETVLRTF